MQMGCRDEMSVSSPLSVGYKRREKTISAVQRVLKMGTSGTSGRNGRGGSEKVWDS
jgi:hypothetical protein